MRKEVVEKVDEFGGGIGSVKAAAAFFGTTSANISYHLKQAERSILTTRPENERLHEAWLQSGGDLTRACEILSCSEQSARRWFGPDDLGLFEPRAYNSWTPEEEARLARRYIVERNKGAGRRNAFAATFERHSEASVLRKASSISSIDLSDARREAPRPWQQQPRLTAAELDELYADLAEGSETLWRWARRYPEPRKLVVELRRADLARYERERLAAQQRHRPANPYGHLYDKLAQSGLSANAWAAEAGYGKNVLSAMRRADDAHFAQALAETQRRQQATRCEQLDNLYADLAESGLPITAWARVRGHSSRTLKAMRQPNPARYARACADARERQQRAKQEKLYKELAASGLPITVWAKEYGHSTRVLHAMSHADPARYEQELKAAQARHGKSPTHKGRGHEVRVGDSLRRKFRKRFGLDDFDNRLSLGAADLVLIANGRIYAVQCEHHSSARKPNEAKWNRLYAFASLLDNAVPVYARVGPDGAEYFELTGERKGSLTPMEPFDWEADLLQREREMSERERELAALARPSAPSKKKTRPATSTT